MQNSMLQFIFSVFDINFCPKIPFGFLMLPDYRPSSLLTEDILKPVAFLFKFNSFDFMEKMRILGDCAKNTKKRPRNLQHSY